MAIIHLPALPEGICVTPDRRRLGTLQEIVTVLNAASPTPCATIIPPGENTEYPYGAVMIGPQVTNSALTAFSHRFGMNLPDLQLMVRPLKAPYN